jgi:hypothetical protein
MSRATQALAVLTVLAVSLTGCGDGTETSPAKSGSVDARVTTSVSTGVTDSAPTVTTVVSTDEPSMTVAASTTSAVAEERLDGVVVQQFWGTPGVEEAGWLLVDVTSGGTVDDSSRVALYVPFAHVSRCDVADPDAYYQLVSRLPVSFVLEPLIGGAVPYPDEQPPWQGVPRRNATRMDACPPSGADGADELADQRAMWQTTDITDYEFVVFWGGFNAANGYHKLTVFGGQSARLEPLDLARFEGLTPEEQQAAMDSVPATIDEVFGVLARADTAAWMHVEYHPELGYPRLAYVDDDLSNVDDELDIRVSLLRIAGAPSVDPVPPGADTAAVVAAAVGAHTGQADEYDSFQVVDRLSQLSGTTIDVSADSRPLSNDERAAVETILSPRVVAWVPNFRTIGDNPPQIAERQAILTITEPFIDGPLAEVTVELWCGMTCAGALTYILERSATGQWLVIGGTGGWVS